MAENKLRVFNDISWKNKAVGNWIESLGFPQYRPCFVDNQIDGRKFILINASKLPDVNKTFLETFRKKIFFRLASPISNILKKFAKQSEICLSKENLIITDQFQDRMRSQHTRTGLIFLSLVKLEIIYFDLCIAYRV